MDKNIMKITKSEIVSIDNYNKKLQEQNLKLANLRKKQLFIALKQASELRIKTAKNVDKWVDILADKLFSPQIMEKMDPIKLIMLFKYVNNLGTKLLSDSNKVEDILGKYLTADSSMEYDLPESVQSDNDKIKAEVLSKLKKMMENATDEDAEVIVVEKNEESQNVEKTTQEEVDSLSDVEVPIEDNLDLIEEADEQQNDEKPEEQDATELDFDFDDDE